MKKIGKYEILSELGRGGMGLVYKGFDPLIGREVAIKIIEEQALALPQIKERFYREARSAGRLSHPGITIVYDVGEVRGKPFIVMEYLEGKDLEEIIHLKTPMGILKKLNTAIEVCSALAYSHSQDVVHRDIKPGNIRILNNGRVKLMDFGIAKAPQSNSMTVAGAVLGSPYYMSPEQVKGSAIDLRTDIFSFGIVLFELLSYKLPYAGDNPNTVMYKIVNAEPTELEIKELNKYSDIKTIINKCLQKSPLERYQSFDEVKQGLEEVVKRLSDEMRAKLGTLIEESKNSLREEKFEIARSYANDAKTLDPNNLEVLQLSSNIDQREAQFKRNEQSEKRINLAKELIEADRFENAKRLLEQFEFEDSFDSKRAELLDKIESLIDNEQKNETILRLITESKIFLRSNNFAAAMVNVEKVRTLDSMNKDASEIQKLVLIKKAKYELEQFLKVVDSLIENGRFEDALKRIEDSVGLDTEDNLIQGRIREARNGLEVQEAKKAFKGKIGQVQNLIKANQYQEASEILTTIHPDFKLHPEVVQIQAELKMYNALANLPVKLQALEKLVNGKEYSEAIIYLENYIERDADNVYAKDLLANIKDTFAHRILEKNKETLLRRANAKLMTGDIEGAQELALGAYKLKENDTETKSVLDLINQRKKVDLVDKKLDQASLCFSEQLYDEARQIIVEVLELDAENGEAVELLKRVNSEAQISLEYENKRTLAKTRINTNSLKATKLVMETPQKDVLEGISIQGSATKPKFLLPFISGATLLLIVAVWLIKPLFTPLPPMGKVAINILPWAKIEKVINLEDNTDMLSELSDDERLTPCLLQLPAGSYRIYASNPGLGSEVVEVIIPVGKVKNVYRRMSGFDISELTGHR